MILYCGIGGCAGLKGIFRSGVKGQQTKVAAVFGDYRTTGLTSQLNLDLSQFTKRQLTTLSSAEKVYFKCLKLKSYCFYRRLCILEAVGQFGLRCEALCACL